jgi:FKBP-type peptidyl-prolyl cis-trans isomerase
MPRFPFRARSVIGALLVLSAVSVTACGDSTTAPTIESTTFASSLNVDLAASTKAGDMYYRDLVSGTGAPVAFGKLISVHYTGWLADGTQFDTNGPTATPLGFHLGEGEVISGWDIGITGMHVGGTRQLIIPPSLGYGSKGSGKIPGNAILVFTVTVVGAQ